MSEILPIIPHIRNEAVNFKNIYGKYPKWLILTQNGYDWLLQAAKAVNPITMIKIDTFDNMTILMTIKDDIIFELF